MALTIIAPTSVAAGSEGLVLVVGGSTYGANTALRWNGKTRPTTWDAGTSHASAPITALDLLTPGDVAITAYNVDTAAESAPVTLTIGPFPDVEEPAHPWLPE